MKGRIIADWSKVRFDNPEDARKVYGALQAFLTAPDRVPELKAAIQAFGTKGDFPAEILQVLEKYNQTPYYDTAYETVFDIRDFTGTNESGFDLLDVTSGLAFSLVIPGEKAKVYKMSGAKTRVTFDKYGGGLMWDRTFIDDKQYWTLEDNTIAFRNEAYRSRAQAFYDLIEATAATYNVAWQAVDGAIPNTNENYMLIRDCNTINYACNAILGRIKSLGLGASTNSPFILLAPDVLKSRLLRALALNQQAFAGSKQYVVYNVLPMFSLMLTNTSTYYVIFPKGKLKGGYRMDLTLMGQTDILAYADTLAGWMRYGGAIGELKQLARCATA